MPTGTGCRQQHPQQGWSTQGSLAWYFHGPWPGFPGVPSPGFPRVSGPVSRGPWPGFPGVLSPVSRGPWPGFPVSLSRFSRGSPARFPAAPAQQRWEGERAAAAERGRLGMQTVLLSNVFLSRADSSSLHSSCAAATLGSSLRAPAQPAAPALRVSQGPGPSGPSRTRWEVTVPSLGATPQPSWSGIPPWKGFLEQECWQGFVLRHLCRSALPPAAPEPLPP